MGVDRDKKVWPEKCFHKEFRISILFEEKV